MDILQTVKTHTAAMRLPLYAVTLSAIPQPDTPVMLILHWHGFRRHMPFNVSGLAMPLRSVAGSAMQINARWNHVEELDLAMLHAAWRLGAWNLERANHRPWWRLNAGQSESLACQRAFGLFPDAPDDQAMVVEAPDHAFMLEQAGLKGYVHWQFRPRVSGVWAQIESDDVTLAADGTRRSLCPISPKPYDRHRAGSETYRLGLGDGLRV